MKGPSMPCPHCKSKTKIIKSRYMGLLMKEYSYSCRNIHCGHTFVCSLEVARTLSPPAVPNPEVSIPLSPHVRQQPKLAPST